MMNKIIYSLLVLVIFWSCDSESVNDCFQQSGTIITQEIDVPVFTKIRVNRDVSLVLKEGLVQEVKVETGENLLNDVEFIVSGDWLTITDNNTCNFVRDYNVTKVYVTVPNLLEILSSTQFEINSDGVLNFENLNIISENFIHTSVNAVGDIYLNLNSQNIEVVGNNLTNFTLEGVVSDLKVNFASGDGKLNARDLVANKVDVFHRGTNTITVNPIQELSAELRSTGDLIVVNEPPVTDIEEHYTGEVIFE
ncbi:head GIN domain-containing protein [Pseudofulvibacter geojedonensis]|uniref:Head GIN domain-containing protein n=1 Tax=Pseudofulvibacter geojedonensis TaxID=1123758 RepID=A0ABW3I1U6_9FLAO